MRTTATRLVAVLALAGAGFAVGSLLSPSNADTRPRTQATTTVAARAVINAPDTSARVPALARVKRHHAKKQPAKQSTATTTQPDAGVSGTVAQQVGTRQSTGTSTQAKQTQPEQKQTTTQETSTQPDQFDTHTPSTP